MPILHRQRSMRPQYLENVTKPNLYRDIFPYTSIGRTDFDDVLLAPRPANPMRITDTTFRDGQQARPPYTVKQIVHIFDLIYKLGGKSGLIQASEFFIYSDKDRKAIEACRARGYRFPKVTGWIRANIEDLVTARAMEFEEVGMLTSVSDYHIFLKLGKTRQQAFDDYIRIVEKALEWGIVPRCHFEDITRADMYGFCVPLAQRLMDMARQSGMPIKIRLCDTMGFGVPYEGASLPRSVQRIVRTFTDDANVPGAWLEWHGHNDFHKVLVNGVTAWLHGCSSINGTLLGFGERTGNTPLEALVIEYISLTGDDNAADTTAINEIATYFENELDYTIPYNYPFVGRDFNATRAGVHIDGLAKNEEIYNIFDTTSILNRPVPIIITDKTGRAGVAYWINNTLKCSTKKRISKKHPAVGTIYEYIMQTYEAGRNTSYSHREMKALVQMYMPELFISEFDQMKRLAGELAATLVVKFVRNIHLLDAQYREECLNTFVCTYPFIQYAYFTNIQGILQCACIADVTYGEKYKTFSIGHDFSEREWFCLPMRSGDLHITDVHQSAITGQLILTVSCAVTDSHDKIVGVLGADVQLESLLRRAQMLKSEVASDMSEDE